MATSTNSDAGLLTVIAYMKAAPGKTDELRRELQDLIETTHREAGCVNYDLHESIEEPGKFFFHENWESEEHLDAHLAAPHLVRFAGLIPNLLDEDGLTINRLQRL